MVLGPVGVVAVVVVVVRVFEESERVPSFIGLVDLVAVPF
jgi:hypothetical protein